MTGKSVFWVEYKSAKNGRVARFPCKVPYGQAPDLLLKLNRAFQTGQVSRFTLEDLKPGQLTPDMREGLLRWIVALEITGQKLKVDWYA